MTPAQAYEQAEQLDRAAERLAVFAHDLQRRATYFANRANLNRELARSLRREAHGDAA